MALVLTETDVRSIITMPLAVEAVDASFRRLAAGHAQTQPRRRLPFGERRFMHYMAGSDADAGYVGMKIYATSSQGARFLIPLFRNETGELAALIDGDYLGQVRTGAASGVATRYMAREDARQVGIIGTGKQARTQLEAVAHVRQLESIRAYGRDAARRESFTAEMTERLSIPVTPVSSAEEAVRGADIVITMTSAAKPVLQGRWLEAGTHMNATGSNWAQKAELDTEAVRRCDLIAADSVEQSRIEAGDLIQAFAALGGDAKAHWDRVHELADVIAGKTLGRTNADQITLFKSNGIATEDVTVAARVYELARERGVGRELPEPK
jgi:alanine dehydrogenase